MILSKQSRIQFKKKKSVDFDNQEEAIRYLLKSDLDFHQTKTNYGTHKLHSFPAKFPPQVPIKFIEALTQPGQTVLDPMMGSGTTVIESIKRNRNAIGFDLDPLSILMVRVKSQNYDKRVLRKIGKQALQKARELYKEKKKLLKKYFENNFDKKTKTFIHYWFAESTILELTSLIFVINEAEKNKVKDFLKIVFSSTIITKTGGVSLALDLAHTRPHKAKKVFDIDDRLLYEKDLSKYSSRRQEILTKKLRSAFNLFNSKLEENIKAVFSGINQIAQIEKADAQQLILQDNTVDLIVTSPPYAANAIDYMRAHKFSLVWFGYKINELSNIRSDYIGGEATNSFNFEKMPPVVQEKIEELRNVDQKKSKVLHRYYTETNKMLLEMHRVLKPNSCAILVVGNSNMRGVNTEVQKCLPAIGKSQGFKIPAIGVRNLDRNKRMMPAGFEINNASQIEQRMHLEYVISFLKK